MTAFARLPIDEAMPGLTVSLVRSTKFILVEPPGRAAALTNEHVETLNCG
jgi:hypothetical protein